MQKLLLTAIVPALLLTPTTFADDNAPPIPVSIQIDTAKPRGPLTPIWRFFGYDECNFTYMHDGQQLLSEIAQLQPHPIFIRCHHLLTSGNPDELALKWGATNIYTEDAQGNPVYDFTTVDKIFDTYIHLGLKPYAQLGFMPKALSTHPEKYPTHFDPEKRIANDEGVAYPPKDYNKWRELARTWVAHCIDRYGKDEVNSWYWEVWNEPNISYWRGTPEEFFKLYDYAADGIRAALPTAKVGGPETAADSRFTTRFLNHIAHDKSFATGNTIPYDFISFHAKGDPKFLDNHVRMGIGAQLTAIDRNFAAIEKFPTLNQLPIVIGESDPDGMAARLPSDNPAVGYRNTTLFSSYTADCIAREYDLADAHHVNLEGALTWSFEFENKPFFPGFRVLSSNGIDHPVFNVFRMLSKMSGTRLDVQSSASFSTPDIAKSGVRQSPDISALAAKNNNTLSVMLWNYHDDDTPGPTADITLTLNNLPPNTTSATLTKFLIDQTHSNAYTLWQQMGSPEKPSPDQYEKLKSAAQLAQTGDPRTLNIQNSNAEIKLALPRQAVELLVIDFKP